MEMLIVVIVLAVVAIAIFVIYIKQGSLFCGSKEKYDEQMEWIAQNQTRLTPGCLVTGVDIDVVFLDRGFLKSSVKSINNSEVYWVGNESLGQH